MQNVLIRFDWAMKRLLRQKSNFVILEGFLSELLKEDIKIEQLLESESNQETNEDKFNRVDILALNSKQELIIVEIQNSKQIDYFQRMLFGVSKATTEYLSLGENYGKIKKVYSVNIVYFDLGQGKDYVYHGKTEFRGIHNGEKLELSQRQKELFEKQEIHHIFPEYYVLKVNNFDDIAKDTLDEWIYYLKNDTILTNAKAKGLKEVSEHLHLYDLNDTDRKAYMRHIENNRITMSVLETAKIDGLAEGRAEGRAEGEKVAKLETARKMKQKGFDVETIIELTGLSSNEIEQL